MTTISPGAVALWRRVRLPAAIITIILAVSLLAALLNSGDSTEELAPESYRPDGAHALAELLTAQGVRVEVTRTLADTERALAGGPPATLLVTRPDLVPDGRLTGYTRTARELVLVGAGPGTVAAVLPEVAVAGAAEPAARQPDCALEAGVAAGQADTGGLHYATTDPAVVACYEDTVVRRMNPPGAAVTLLGDGTPLVNERIADNGNAALAMRLLGGQPRLVWYLPTPGDPDLAAEEKTVTGLLPDGIVFGVIQLAVAVVLFGLWRARRLGPVVTEPLPVVVRAAETVEGRARLYRRSGDTAHAAAVLRAAVVARLAPRLGLPPDAEPDAVAAAVAARTTRPPAEVAHLLYGPAPAGDADLVRLAAGLDALETEVTA
ncbi:DUF4350 domain-containing protein [Amycolatopsis suaedae]|uniref:DUF4350 domain-containing protein n=1 Tax=Amycolatopsis suaedae TaxID=2510978 RepID=A0A4Q7J755_9PSEU|nr:DUF4350 domain-containing protein [Amycolatopsis suaedae]RZQ62612.1 DUF4350 domain-containing protein [Amycolatopsis suaedae]